jgi:ribonuclease R
MTKKQEKKKHSKKKEQSTGLLTGTLDITRSGMGFVIVDQLENDIIVRPSDFNTALNGDTVRVRIVSDGTSRGKRSQGQVVEVVKRKQSEFLGKLQFSKNFAFFHSGK